jgi:hypothetical protein
MGVQFHRPPDYLSKGPARIQPVGGGQALLDAPGRSAKVVPAARFSDAQRKCILQDTAQGVFRVRPDCRCPR